jgi:SAM-dependent methyltransferase
LKQPDWYKYAWTLDIKNESWTENTEKQVDFIIKTLALTGKESILDLACGYGRHSLAFAGKGFSVTGVDITKAYIDDAKKTAHELSLDATFICADIREIIYREQFDVVLNLADGAIGYLENDEENLKIFDIIANSLKSGGKHFMDIGNAEYAERNFPTTHWESGTKMLALAQFGWDAKTKCMTYGGWDIPYGEIMQKPNIDMENADPIRLYSLDELERILQKRGMKVISDFADYSSRKSSAKEMQLNVYSIKQ